MSEERLDPKLAALLAHEKAAVPSSAAFEHLWSRVAGIVSGPPSGGGGGGGSTPPPAVSAAGSHLAVVALMAALAGGGIGAGLVVALRSPPTERIVYVDRVVVSPPAVSAKPSPEIAPLAVVVASANAPTHAPVAAAPSSTASSSQLDRERALLDDARAALVSGDGTTALSLAEEHGTRFPRPTLFEEREAIAVQALVLLGRYDDARARAARFRAAAPNSVFLQVIDASLGSIP